MPRGDKSKYSDKQQRQARHIEEGYESRGLSENEAERRAWATVNKMTGGGKEKVAPAAESRQTRPPCARAGGSAVRGPPGRSKEQPRLRQRRPPKRASDGRPPPAGRSRYAPCELRKTRSTLFAAARKQAGRWRSRHQGNAGRLRHRRNSRLPVGRGLLPKEARMGS